MYSLYSLNYTRNTVFEFAFAMGVRHAIAESFTDCIVGVIQAVHS